MDYIWTLLITIFVEFIVLALFFRKPLGKALFYAILINCFTHPIASFVYWNLSNNLLLIEIAVFLAEGLLIFALFRTGWKKAFLASFAANFITTLLGVLFL